MIFMFIIFNQNQEIRKSLNPRAFKLCGLRQLLLHQLLRQLHYIRRMNAEEDVQDLRLLLSGLDPTQGIMLLLRSERSLHRCGANSRKFLSHKVFLSFLLRALAFLDKGCLDAITRAHLTVGVTGITRITAYLLHIHPEQSLMHLDAVCQCNAPT